MMAMTRMLAMMSLVVALGMVASQPSQAAPLVFNSAGFLDSRFNVSTAGVDGSDRSVEGPEAIRFQGVNSGSIEPGGFVSLGEFEIKPVAGSTTTYNDTPFTIEVRVPALDKFVMPGEPETGFHEGGFHVRGTINGTINPDGSGDLRISYDSAEMGYPNGVIAAVSYYHDFPIPMSDVKLGRTIVAQFGANTGTVTYAYEVEVVPEPASVAVFALAAAGLAWHRNRRKTSRA